MSDKEDKKSLSSIGVLKKTAEGDSTKEGEIGVEADIPVEGDNPIDDANLNTEWKVNQPQKVEEKKSETPEPESPKIDLKISESKVQVFNISAGRVMEKDLSEPKETDKKTSSSSSIYVDKSVLEKNRRPASAIKQNSQGVSSKLIIGIVAGIILLLILIFLVFSRGGNSDSSSNSLSQPQINLTK